MHKIFKHHTSSSDMTSTTSNHLPLDNKVALVTGSSKGIGRAIAIKYASLGAKVVVNYSGDEGAANEVVNAIGASNAIAIKADVGKVDQINSLIDEVIKVYGKLDILVCNAGVMPLNELDKLTEEEFDRVFWNQCQGTTVSGEGELSTYPRPWIIGTDNPSESSTAHAFRLSHYPLLYNPLRRIHRGAKLPRLRLFQRSNRANDSPSLQRFGQKGHHG